VVDFDGIYFDPARPSGLERILTETAFDAPLLARAQRVINRVVTHGISKYGAAAGRITGFAGTAPAGRRQILVPGQVADDLSVRLGGAGTASNLELLQRVRQANPDAMILYKPHPDVDAGHRQGAIPDDVIMGLADRLVRGVPMPALINAVDEVHTITSLTGFEALIRGKAVTCYGQPFYAGWGLTRDIVPLPRRQRRLSILELAAGALLLYPRYLDPVTLLPCPVEVLLDRLADPAAAHVFGRRTLLSRGRQLQGQIKRRLGQWRPRPVFPAVAEGRF
jgi:capsular polysaccharide export protein